MVLRSGKQTRADRIMVFRTV